VEERARGAETLFRTRTETAGAERPCSPKEAGSEHTGWGGGRSLASISESGCLAGFHRSRTGSAGAFGRKRCEAGLRWGIASGSFRRLQTAGLPDDWAGPERRIGYVVMPQRVGRPDGLRPARKAERAPVGLRPGWTLGEAGIEVRFDRGRAKRVKEMEFAPDPKARQGRQGARPFPALGSQAELASPDTEG
jgi:hypothetical protein